MPGLQTLLSRLSIQLDILILTECWLSCNPNIPLLEGYNSYSTTKRINKNDGVVVYVKNNITNITVIEPDFTDANCIQIKIGTDTCIFAIYRPPSFKEVTNFLSSLNQLLTTNASYSNMIITGDINIDIAEGNTDPKTPEYLNLNASHGLLPAHNLVTHDKTSIDHALVKTKFKATTIVIDSTLTDHNAVLLALDKVKTDRTQSRKTKIDYNEFENHIKYADFSFIYECDGVNVALEYFVNSITRALRMSSRSYDVPHRLRIIKPWVTSGMLRCMRNRDRMYIKMKSVPNNEIIKITFKRYRNYCSTILKNLKRQYEREELNKAKNNPKKMWNIIKEITHTTKTNVPASPLLKIKSSLKESINEVNNFFTSIGRELADEVTKSSLSNLTAVTEPDSATFSNSFVFLETDELEVEQIILTLRSNCAIGIDGISSDLLKRYKKILIPPLTYIINQCLLTGVFPDLLKKALIHPIHKSGDVDRVNNYRPISVLPSLSKVLERIMNNRLKKYLEANKLLSINQYGFRNNTSTNEAVHDLTEHVVEALDRGEKCVAIFLDLAKAFDTVSIPKLILKLEKIGIRDTQLKLFQSYLTNRKQSVKIGDNISSDLPIVYGVPQGSILGPSLFLVYVNDMCKLHLPDGKLLAFADDTALVFKGPTWEQVFNAAQIGFNIITKWLSDNTLSLNVDKTKYLLFSIKKPKINNESFSITAHNHTANTQLVCKCPKLKNAAAVKYLGVILDERLTFVPQIEQLTGRIRKLIYVFKHLRHVAEPKTLKTVYYALCQSLIGYCVSSWGGAGISNLLRLERAQRAVLKVCTFKPFLYPTKELYEYCEVLTVRQLFILQIILRQHTHISKSGHLSSSGLQATRRVKFPLGVTRRTSFSQRFFCFLGRFLYAKANKILTIDHKNKYECKKIVTDWLLKLTYEETENLLHPLA